MQSLPRIYTEDAAWFHLLTAPESYAEEAGYYTAALKSAASGPLRSLLELGSGGGNNALHMKAAFEEIVLTDLSAEMLALSRTINPELQHVQGDMRTLRLGRTFDGVFVHDAVAYMTTEADLRAAIETAAAHCRPGGAVIFAPDCTTETFREGTDHGGHDAPDGRGLRYLAWTWDPDPGDTAYTVDYAYLMRAAEGSVRAAQDRHVEGVFPRAVWLRLLEGAGFEARRLDFRHSELDEPIDVFSGTKRAQKPLRTRPGQSAPERDPQATVCDGRHTPRESTPR